jgi:hypothetical protein
MSMNSGRLIHKEFLPNCLRLEIWDHSRPVAGDRWYTRLEIRIIIPLRQELPQELKPQADKIVAALGEEVAFSHQEEWNFIAAVDLPVVLQDMQDRILQLAPGYYGHKDFAAKFIRKTYAAYMERSQP